MLPLPNEVDSGRTVRRLEAHEEERIVLGRAEKVLLGEAFGLSRTWSVHADKLVKRWEVLSAQRNANVELAPTEKSDLKASSKQMEIIFDDDLVEA